MHIPFTIKGRQSGSRLARVSALLITDPATGDAENSSGTAIPGCLTRWFKVTLDADNPALSAALDHGETYHGHIDIAMTDAPVDHDACKRQALSVAVVARP